MSCQCPMCKSSGPRVRALAAMGFTEPERLEVTLRDPEMRAYAQQLIEERKARILARRSGEVDIPLPDLRAAIDARHVACGTTSKNIVNRPGPEPKYPSRPASSPHVDQMARDKFEVEPLVDPPATIDELKIAIDNARS